MGNYYILNSNVSVSDGQWHVVTLARIGTATQLSIDGITQKIVEQASAANLTNSARLLAGTADARVCGGIEAPFVGKIDNVQVISGQ